MPTELTSTHLGTLRADPWVEAAGTLANLAVGGCSLLASRKAGDRANLRYFLWLLAALNLLPAAGYFLYSGIAGVGDWYVIVRELPNPVAIRIAMALCGAALYYLSVWLLAAEIQPFVDEKESYDTVGKLPYWVAGLFSCIAGIFEPLGWRILLMSTLPAAFGGMSGCRVRPPDQI